MLSSSKKISAVVFASLLLPGCRQNCNLDLDEHFSGRYGQVEVGGPYVGMEFHHSRPLPSRISFYYPVANSLDLSTDYWRRDLSLPLQIEISCSRRVARFGLEPAEYRYSPHSVTFQDTLLGCRIELSYEFADLPTAVVTLSADPLSAQIDSLEIAFLLDPTLRTCHTYAVKSPTAVLSDADSRLACAYYDDAETDSAAVFLLSLNGFDFREPFTSSLQTVDSAILKARFRTCASAGKPVRSRWLIGSCRRNELLQILERVGQEWVKGVNRLEQKILDEIRSADFVTPDPVINKTMRWSKATVVALHHYMDGRLVPMPCPAEYNFFFTHDFLLTGLGAGVYSREFLQNGYDFLLSKTESDSLLPHAYYWKDGRYVTEKCAADNWNHLWFIISAGTYLKHTGDRETIGRLYPVLQKSLRSALQNLGDDRLMYSSRPDWWDIGNLYGARAYLTVLTIRALQEFVSLSWMIGASCPDDSLLGLAESMKTALTQKLWCDELGYLINGLDRASLDYHYYSGSLLACLFDAIDDGKKLLLINTARQKLFDPRLGIRNAWPPDFHKLIKVYRFNGLEVGLPYYYFNGGIWMHGNAWYALSLIEAGQIDEAVQFVKAIMTPDGVRNSPKGQPSFYEYRMSDPTDSLYGAVDKPNFLWAAGWAIQTLYRLAGLRLDPWQISFSAHLPFGWKQIEYELLLYGTLCRVRCSGNGRFFRRIEIDGQQSCSAVLNRPAKNILLQRGKPIVPYLAAVTGRLQTVSYHPHDRCLVIETAYVTGQAVRLTVVSPWPLQRILVNGKEPNQVAAWKEEEGAYAIKIENTCRSTSERFSLFF